MAVLITSLYFINHNKKEEFNLVQNNATSRYVLPPKPIERWRYIKELENKKPRISRINKSSITNKVKNSHKMTNNHNQKMAKILIDIYSKQSPQLDLIVPGKQSKYHPKASEELQKEQWNVKKSVSKNRKIELDSFQKKVTVQIKKQTSHPYQNLLYPSLHSINKDLKIQEKPIKEKKRNNITGMLEEMKEGNREPIWSIQCGSFIEGKQAEIMHAQLAFRGFQSQISNNNGRNYVIILSGRDKKGADSVLSRLELIGYTNCIQLVSRG